MAELNGLPKPLTGIFEAVKAAATVVAKAAEAAATEGAEGGVQPAAPAEPEPGLSPASEVADLSFTPTVYIPGDGGMEVQQVGGGGYGSGAATTGGRGSRLSLAPTPKTTASTTTYV